MNGEGVLTSALILTILFAGVLIWIPPPEGDELLQPVIESHKSVSGNITLRTIPQMEVFGLSHWSPPLIMQVTGEMSGIWNDSLDPHYVVLFQTMTLSVLIQEVKASEGGMGYGRIEGVLELALQTFVDSDEHITVQKFAYEFKAGDIHVKREIVSMIEENNIIIDKSLLIDPFKRFGAGWDVSDSENGRIALRRTGMGVLVEETMETLRIKTCLPFRSIECHIEFPDIDLSFSEATINRGVLPKPAIDSHVTKLNLQLQGGIEADDYHIPSALGGNFSGPYGLESAQISYHPLLGLVPEDFAEYGTLENRDFAYQELDPLSGLQEVFGWPISPIEARNTSLVYRQGSSSSWSLLILSSNGEVDRVIEGICSGL